MPQKKELPANRSSINPTVSPGRSSPTSPKYKPGSQKIDKPQNPPSPPRRCMPHKKETLANRSTIDPTVSSRESSQVNNPVSQTPSSTQRPLSPPRRCIPQKKTFSVNRSSTDTPVISRTSSSITSNVCQDANKPQNQPSSPWNFMQEVKTTLATSANSSPINPSVSHQTSSQITNTACQTMNKPQTMKSSCNTKAGKKKCATWQEITKNEKGKLVMMRVKDLGVAASTRIRKTSMKNKDLGAAASTRLRGTATAMRRGNELEDSNCSSKKKPDEEKKQNKPRRRQEAATPTSTATQMESRENMKKTFRQEKVKTVSNTRRTNIAKITPCSPTLKRLTSGRLSTKAARMNFSPRKQENSQVNFKKLLSTWEDLSTRNLTPAVLKRTKLGNFVDGQSQLTLENGRENFEMGDCPLIGGGFEKSQGFGKTSQ